MAIGQKSGHGEEWHLGIETGEHQEPAITERPAEVPYDLSHERLERPLQVVTVEHLGWGAIAVYATITRLIALGARPLDGVEAGHALYELELTNTGAQAADALHPASGGWIHLLTAAIFTLGGANDFTARLAFALSGLIMIAMAFALRHQLGRAGGLALAAMLALSPSIAWFSRASAMAMPAAAMSLVTIAAFMALKSRPLAVRAAALGLFAGLMIAADSIGLATAVIFVAALIPLGLWELITRKNVALAIRVWLDRYSSRLVLVIVAAAVVWALSQMILAGGLDETGIAQGMATAGGSGHAGLNLGLDGLRGFISGFTTGLHDYAPRLTLYEFMIVVAAVFGAVVTITGNARSRFATWALIWTALSVAFFAWSRGPASASGAGSILAILTPAAVIGAIGIDWLHHSDGWRLVRIPLAAIAALTLYIGAIANFVYDAPDASEPSWAPHANLFWGASATTEQARLYSRQAEAGLTPADATVFYDGENFIDGEVPAPIRWYLRDLRSVESAEAATVIVSKAVQPPANAEHPATIYNFDYAEGWIPNFTDARAHEVIRFVLSGRVWGPITNDDMTISAQKPSSSAPTIILTPGQ